MSLRVSSYMRYPSWILPAGASRRTRNGAPRAGTRTGTSGCARPRTGTPGTRPRTPMRAVPRTGTPARTRTRTPLYREEIGLPRDAERRHGRQGWHRVREFGDTEQSEGCGDCQGFYAHQGLVEEPL